jgi:WD40 repeat protein
MAASTASSITSITADEYGHRIAVSTLSHRISISSSPELSPIGTIPKSDSAPLSVAFSSSDLGSLLAGGYSDGTVRIYAYDNGREIRRSEPRTAAILSVAFHPARPAVASASLDDTFNVHTRAGNEWSQITVIASSLGLTAVAWASDIDRIQTLVLGGVDGTIRLYRCAHQN